MEDANLPPTPTASGQYEPDSDESLSDYVDEVLEESSVKCSALSARGFDTSR